jgi:hypothetical protein
MVNYRARRGPPAVQGHRRVFESVTGDAKRNTVHPGQHGPLFTERLRVPAADEGQSGYHATDRLAFGALGSDLNAQRFRASLRESSTTCSNE